MSNPVNIQANLPEQRSTKQLFVDMASGGQKLRVYGAKLIIENGVAIESIRGGSLRLIQNCGTVPVKFLVSNESLADDNNFHGILTACTTDDDGTGNQANFAMVEGRVSIYGVGGTPRVCTYISVAPEGLI